jgi:hypothetical protein
MASMVVGLTRLAFAWVGGISVVAWGLCVLHGTRLSSYPAWAVGRWFGERLGKK